MQGKMKTFEKKLDDGVLKLTKINMEVGLWSKKPNDDLEVVAKIKELNDSIKTTRKQIAASAAAWMSTALTMSSLLEAEEGHRDEMKIVLTDILEKLTTRGEFKALEAPKKHNKTTIENNQKEQILGNNNHGDDEDEEDEFFKTHEDSIRVATLVRLARVEHDLGNFEDALKHSQRAVDEIIAEARRNILLVESPKQQQKRGVNGVDVDDNVYVHLVQNNSIRYEWLLLCKLHAIILAALHRTGAEQNFLKTVSADADKKIDSWNISFQNENLRSDDDAASATGSNVTTDITAIPQEVVAFAELLMRYADSLGLEEGGQGWKGPDDPIFEEKRRTCELLVNKYYPILGRVHPVILQARACLALDCGNKAVSREETVVIMTNLINDAGEHLEQEEIKFKKEEETAEKTGLNDVLGSANEDLFALRSALLLWKRKLALAYADLKRFDLALKLLEETSSASDQVLGVSHPDSIVNLRCWMKVAWVSGNEDTAKALHGKLSAREKPPSI